MSIYSNFGNLHLTKKGGSHLSRNLKASNPGSTKPIFWKYERKCLHTVCLGPSLDYRKSQFSHAAAKECCGAGNLLICLPFYLISILCYADFHLILADAYLTFIESSFAVTVMFICSFVFICSSVLQMSMFLARATVGTSLYFLLRQSVS